MELNTTHNSLFKVDSDLWETTKDIKFHVHTDHPTGAWLAHKDTEGTLEERLIDSGQDF